MMKLDDLTNQARDLLSRYTDAEILTSQAHTTPDEAEILQRLGTAKYKLYKAGGSKAMAQSAVVAVLRERRKSQTL